MRDELKRAMVRVYTAALRAQRVHRGLIVLANAAIKNADVQRRPPGYHLTALDTRAGTLKLALSRPGQLEDQLVTHGEYEPHITELIHWFVGPDQVFVDVGANVGVHALHLAAARPDVTCICFEPHPIVFRQLSQNVRLNGMKNVCCHQMALSDRCGEIDFCVQRPTSYNRGLSSVLPNADLEDEFDIQKVRAATLDSSLEDASRSKVAVVKIDTQGSEEQVLAGMTAVLASSRPVVILEFVSEYLPDPIRSIDAILGRLPDYSVWKIRPPEHGVWTMRAETIEISRFDAEEVATPAFWSDLICFPQERFDFA